MARARFTGGRRKTAHADLRALAPAIVLGLLASACAEQRDPVVWGGSAPHIQIRGENEGVPLNARVVDQEMIDMAFYHCERTYEVPEVLGVEDPSRARLVATKMSFFFRYEERPRTFSITLAQHDVQADPSGTVLRVTPRREGVAIEPDQVVFEMSLADFLLDEDFLHAAAKFGDVTMYEFSGTPPDGSRIIPEGQGSAGFTFDIIFHPEGYFRGSLTAPCTVNHIVPVPE